MTTRRLYYEDSHIRSFTARVIDCRAEGDKWLTELDVTAFFPEGGGQPADTGRLGDAAVTYTFERDGRVLHVTDVPLEVGSEVAGEIDWERRRRAMQNHTAEHMVSGIVHRRFGGSNVGFHMGEDGVIVDFDVFVTPEQLEEVELEANRMVMEDHRVRGWFPPEDVLGTLQYRSKIELTGEVRIVEIEGCDMCACCAPHVASTGEIGVIKIFESIRRKGGVRIRMLAGLDAYNDYCAKARAAAEISALLSAPQEAIGDAVRRLVAGRDELIYKLGGLKRELIALRTERLEPAEGNMVFFEQDFSAEELRMLVNAALPKCGGICAAFSGDDSAGYRYVMASVKCDLRAMSKEINGAIGGRGGGTSGMINGSASASAGIIRKYLGCEEAR